MLLQLDLDVVSSLARWWGYEMLVRTNLSAINIFKT